MTQFDSLKKIRKARVPTLFLSGLADQLIPPRMMTSLYKVHLKNVIEILLSHPHLMHFEILKLSPMYSQISASIFN